jgi:hypothetical protein
VRQSSMLVVARKSSQRILQLPSAKSVSLVGHGISRFFRVHSFGGWMDGWTILNTATAELQNTATAELQNTPVCW